MKTNRTLKDKLKFMLYASVALIILLATGTMVWIRLFLDLPLAVAVLVIFPMMTGGCWMLGKIMDKSKYKAEFDELEKEAEIEEEQKKKRGLKPSIIGLVLLAATIFLLAVFNGIEMVVNMKDNKSIVNYLPDLCMVLTNFILSVLLAKIAYNIRKGKIFYSGNATLIYLIGATIFVSAGIQNHYWDSTAMVPNSTVFTCYMVFVGLCCFFANLFSIAIQIKEEQDLTI